MNPSVVFVICAVLVIAFYLGYHNEKKRIELHIRNVLESYGKNNTRKFTAQELEKAKGYYKCHVSSFSIDDTTWNDLDMWMVYKKINFCLTDSGDEYLYYLLKTPLQSTDGIENTEAMISRIENSEAEREQLVRALFEIGRCLKSDIYTAFDDYEELDNKVDYAINAGYLLSIVLFWVSVPLALAGIVICVCLAIVTYFNKKHKTEPYAACFSYVMRLINGSQRIVNCKIQNFDVIDDLVKELEQIKKLKKRSLLISSGSNGNPLSIIFDYVKMLTHIDLIRFNSIMKAIRSNRDTIDRIITLIGKLDTYLAIAYFRKSIDGYCIPEINNRNEHIIASDIYHPLILNPVKNDFDEEKCVLVTGANASGKSTFLKTVALNAILAQSINTVCASSYSAPLYRVYSALRLKDNIVSGESYYMVEINSIKRIIDCASQNGNRVLTIIDEILKGTNTTERIAAGASILKKLSELGAYVIAATHDLELAYILDTIFENYHFKEDMSDVDVNFTYLLHHGVAKSRNAIKLLELKGYDKEIYELAETLARRKEKEGIWLL